MRLTELSKNRIKATILSLKHSLRSDKYLMDNYGQGHFIHNAMSGHCLKHDDRSK